MIGASVNRVEGPHKVTGRTRYSAERQDAGETLHGFVVGSAIGTGRIARIDTAAAEAAPGVRLVLTHRNAPEQEPMGPDSDLHDPHPQLDSDRIRHYGQPVALVVADTFEQARGAALLIDVAYEAAAETRYDLEAAHAAAGWHEESRVGDIDKAMAAGPVTVDAVYTTPYHFGQPMELNACIADWRDEMLTLYLAAQMLAPLRDGVAETLRLRKDQVLVDAAYVGGGFGSKIALHAEAILAAMATMRLGKPVKIMMTRRQLFTLVGHRPATLSRIRLAAAADGRLTALGHDGYLQVTDSEHWNEGVAKVGRPLYAAANRLTRQAHVPLDVMAGEPVRGPGEVPGLMSFESAVDELAEKLGIDPVELRLRNDTAVDPEKNVPLSGRRLAECLREGARRFGWAHQPVASRREGRWLIGTGVASSIRGHYQTNTDVRVRILPDQVVVQSDMTDLGTGSYTIMAQVAAAGLGVGLEQVRVELARTDLPKGMGSGGSFGSGNVSVAIDRACKTLREKIEAVSGTAYNDIFAEVRRHFPDGIEAIGQTIGGGKTPSYSQNSIFTYGATFCEVGVDADTAEVRVRRVTGVFSAGRIINQKTARSQMIGGIIWGIGAALHEGAHVDPRTGHWINGDLAEYLIPVHADVPDIDTTFLDDFDEASNHLGTKGIGELGSGGTAGAIANAVYNATGVRVRDFPITIAKLLPGMMARG
jgi:xanthine dehydrogenase YagR molybdenum-binding subunit